MFTHNARRRTRRLQGFLIAIMVLSLAIVSAASDTAKDSDKVSSGPEQLLPPKEPLEGWQMLGEPRTFVPENLWEYINGQADMYVNYGFVKLATAEYARGGDDDKSVTVDVYDMGKKLSAFGIYSQMDSGDLKSANVGIASYVFPPALAFYKSRYFVNLNASWVADDTESMLIKFARLVSGRISDDGKPPQEAYLLPAENRIPGTLLYVPSSLLGHEFLSGGMEAEYKIADAKVKLLVSFFNNTKDAEKAFATYRTYITARGKNLIDAELSGCKAFSAEEPYQENVLIVLYDKWLVGATHLKAADQGKPLIEKVLATLKK